MKPLISEPTSTIISIKMSPDMSVVKKYWWKNMLTWIVSFLSGRTNSIGKANACQTQIKLRNQVCVDSIKKTFYQIVCSEEKLFLCSCQTETYSIWKQYFSSSIAERSGRLDFIGLFWSEVSNLGESERQTCNIDVKIKCLQIYFPRRIPRHWKVRNGFFYFDIFYIMAT